MREEMNSFVISINLLCLEEEVVKRVQVYITWRRCSSQKTSPLPIKCIYIIIAIRNFLIPYYKVFIIAVHNFFKQMNNIIAIDSAGRCELNVILTVYLLEQLHMQMISCYNQLVWCRWELCRIFVINLVFYEI